MQGDADALHRGVTVLSYGRSMIHEICNQLDQAVKDAGSSNSGGRFKKCTNRISESVKKMRDAAEDLARVGQTMERLEYIIRNMDGE